MLKLSSIFIISMILFGCKSEYMGDEEKYKNKVIVLTQDVKVTGFSTGSIALFFDKNKSKEDSNIYDFTLKAGTKFFVREQMDVKGGCENPSYFPLKVESSDKLFTKEFFDNIRILHGESFVPKDGYLRIDLYKDYKHNPNYISIREQ